MCALAGYHTYTSAFVQPGTKTSNKGQGVAHYRSATSMTQIDEPTSHRAHTGKLDLQRHRIDVHVTYLQVCASMTLYARLPTLLVGRSPKTAAALCHIMYIENRSRGVPFFFFLVD